MKRNHLLEATLAVCLAITLAVAIVIPTLAGSREDIANPEDKTNHGSVEINLPPGGAALANRPTTLVFLPYDYDESMNSADVLVVAMWIQSMNSFVPVAVINDQAPTAQIKALWNNTAVYLEVNGAVIRSNLKTVSDDQLQIWTSQHGIARDVVLMANLTVPVSLDFTGLPTTVFGSSFTVPVLTMMFRQIGDGFDHQEIQSFPNGYAVKSTHTDIPAWVHVSMPAWGYSPTVSGIIIYHENQTLTPPA